MLYPQFSLVVSTLGRTDELRVLFESLERQTLNSFEVIVVDQNDDDRLKPILEHWSFPLIHMRAPHLRGISRGRNAGASVAKGDILLFPDDDCWYPSDLMQHAAAVFAATSAAIVCGRAADETGRSINGRFEKVAQFFGRGKVWTCQIEWMFFIRRSVFESLGGYDEAVGVGASTPWQACEGPELTLRAAEHAVKMFYDPALVGHHPELNTASPDDAMVRKGRAYGRGMGYVLRKSHHTVLHAVYWIARPLIRAAFASVCFNFRRAQYLVNVALGRYEGYLANADRLAGRTSLRAAARVKSSSVTTNGEKGAGSCSPQ